jgi:hypothetical protein
MYLLKPKKCTAAKFFFGLLSSLSFNFSQTGSFFRAQLCKSCGAMFRLQVSSRYLQIKLYFVPGSCQAPFTEFYVFEVYVPIFIFREENGINVCRKEESNCSVVDCSSKDCDELTRGRVNIAKLGTAQVKINT